jgi:hypothetical protein
MHAFSISLLIVKLPSCSLRIWIDRRSFRSWRLFSFLGLPIVSLRVFLQTLPVISILLILHTVARETLHSLATSRMKKPRKIVHQSFCLVVLCIVDVNRDLFKIWMSVGKPGGHGRWHIREMRMLMNVSSQSWKIYSMCQEVSDHHFKGITSAVYMLCHNFTGNIRGSIHQRTVLRLYTSTV